MNEAEANATARALRAHVVRSMHGVPDAAHFDEGIDTIADDGTIAMDNGQRYRIAVYPLD